LAIADKTRIDNADKCHDAKQFFEISFFRDFFIVTYDFFFVTCLPVKIIGQRRQAGLQRNEIGQITRDEN